MPSSAGVTRDVDIVRQQARNEARIVGRHVGRKCLAVAEIAVIWSPWMVTYLTWPCIDLLM